MADTNDMVYITQREFEKLVCQYTSSIREAKQRMIREYSPQTYRAGVQYCLVAETAEAGMTVYNLNLLSDDNIAKNWKEREHRWKRASSVYY